MRATKIWEFRTRRLSVALEVEPDDCDPADSFEFPEDVEFANSGDPWAWFYARVVVRDREGNELGDDSLGGCSYRSWEDFYAAHRDADPANRNCAATLQRHTICHYFPSMVREACRRARATLEMHAEAIGR